MSDNGLLVAELLAALPERQRNLVSAVRDPSSVAGTLRITGARALDLAGESDLTFCKGTTPELLRLLCATRSRVVVVNSNVLPALPGEFGDNRVLVVTHRPRLVLGCLLVHLAEVMGISSQTMAVHPAARIASDAVVGPGVVIGADVEIGRGCVVGPNTVIDHAIVGERSRIGYNCSIGADGFGYEVDDETGEVLKFPHFGRVLIGERVDISSSCHIARGSLRDTILERDVKVDACVHIAHNCHVKRGAIVTANTMLAGSVTIGEYAWIGPSTSVLNGVAVGARAMTGIGAVVIRPVADNELVAGVPARRLRDRFAGPGG